MIEVLVVSLAVGYLLGSIPTGLWLTRWRSGDDIRASGSGRTGATNTYRSLGVRWSVLVMLLDTLKGALPILIVMLVWDRPTGDVLAGLAAIVGHQFPLYAGFRGGRGAATAMGATLPILALGILVALATALPVLLAARVMSLAVLLGATTAALAVALIAWFGGAADSYAGFAAAAWVLIVWGHRDNIQRIADGSERVLAISRSSGTAEGG